MLFKSLFDSSLQSPFKGPLTPAHCDVAAADKQLVAGRSIVAASASANAGDSCEFGSTKFFLLCGVGGIVSCGKLNRYFFFYVKLHNSR